MFICSNCGHSQIKWTGACGNCGTWGSLTEQTEASKRPGKIKEAGKATKSSKLELNPESENTRYPVRSTELSNVLGGGLVPGSFILLSWEPGIGKSTLTLQIADWFSTREHSALYISAEENLAQISARAKRLGIINTHIEILCESVFEHLLATIESSNCELVILDSISVFQSLSMDTNSGSTSLIRSMSEVLMQVAKRSNKTIIVIGHVTKDGSISGPKTLEHLVDTVLFLEGSRYESYRILRALKNRFGPTDEIGLFSMGEFGLTDVKNPWLEFAGSDRSKLLGSALAMTLEGSRPLIVEIEALSTYTKFGYPKRSARGVSTGKLDLVIAILSKYTSAKIEEYDVFANIGRGLSVGEPGVDLALAAAVLSSRRSVSLENTVFIGELSLTGSVKSVIGQQKRIDEARRLGFTRIIVGGANTQDKGKKSADEVMIITSIRELEQIVGKSPKKESENEENSGEM